MSMGNFACSAWTMTWEDIKKIIPEAAHEFEKSLDNLGLDWREFYEYLQEDDNNCVEAWKELALAFEEATLVKKNGEYYCLSLSLGYTNTNSREPYDEVSGIYFEVDGVWDFTPAGKKFKDELTYSRWTEYG